MEKNLLHSKRKKHGGISSPQLCVELDEAQHRLHAYATEGRPMDWAKAVGIPNR
jgi:hypothetical protein